jgi:dienelactone hydrolase
VKPTRADPHPFEVVEAGVVASYARGDYHEALRLLDRGAPDLTDQWERVTYWRVCLLSRLGRTDEAIDTLDQATAAGCWWSPRLLEREADLDPLWSHPGYRPLLERMDRRRRQWDPPVTGLMIAGIPEGWPLLALHGRNQVYEVDARRLGTILGEGWEVAIPESSQRIAADGPVWDDLERCRSQVEAVTDGLWPQRPFVAGGFSQGARRALQLALGSRGRIRGVIAVAPMLLRSTEIAEVIGALAHPPWPLVALVTGADDPARAGVETVAHHLEDEGFEVMVHVEEDRGHGWIQPPRAMAAALAARVGEP